MGNRVHLELRGSDLPILVEEDEEAVVGLTCNNGLPLFWLALWRDQDLDGEWMGQVRSWFADPDGASLEPLSLGWRQAHANLAAACMLAERRLPELFPLLRSWADGIVALAGQGPAQEIRLDLAEYSNFHASADSLLNELRGLVGIWHGADQPKVPPVTDVSHGLTGVDWRTNAPFPATLPLWRPGRAVPGPSPEAGSVGPGPAPGKAAELGMTLVFVAIVLSGALLGWELLGSPGMWLGGGLGLVMACIAVWRWAMRTSPH